MDVSFRGGSFADAARYYFQSKDGVFHQHRKEKKKGLLVFFICLSGGDSGGMDFEGWIEGRSREGFRINSIFFGEVFWPFCKSLRVHPSSPPLILRKKKHTITNKTLSNIG